MLNSQKEKASRVAMDGWLGESKDDGWMDDGWVGGWMIGWVWMYDGWVGGWMDG